MRARFFVSIVVATMLIFISAAASAQGNGLQASDYQKLRSVGQPEISPDGKLIAYTIVRYDRPGVRGAIVGDGCCVEKISADWRGK